MTGVVYLRGTCAAGSRAGKHYESGSKNMTAIHGIPNVPQGNIASITGQAVAPTGIPILAKTVSICDTQPVIAEGIRTLLGGSTDLQFKNGVESLNQALVVLRYCSTDV